MPDDLKELAENDDAVVSFDSETIALIGRIRTQEGCDRVIATLKAMRQFLRARAAS